MPRSVKEWIGKNDDQPFPPRVRDRILQRFNNRCDAAHSGCGREIRPGDKWTCDHIIALINGGENRESNGHPLCGWCCQIKDASDQAVKSHSAKVRQRHRGIKKKQSRPMAGTKASGIKKALTAG